MMALVFGVIDVAAEGTRRQHSLVDLGLGEQLLTDLELIVFIENGKARWQTGIAGQAAQQARPDRVKRPNPARQLGRQVPRLAIFAQQALDPVTQLGGGFVGEGHRKEPLRRHAALEQLGQPKGDDPGLARTGTRQDEQRPVLMVDSFPLRRV